MAHCYVIREKKLDSVVLGLYCSEACAEEAAEGRDETDHAPEHITKEPMPSYKLDGFQESVNDYLGGLACCESCGDNLHDKLGR